MRRAILLFTASLAFALFLGCTGPATGSAAAGGQLLANAGLEAADSTGAAPAWWTQATWGTSTSALTWSADAHGGTHSVKVDVTAYTDGDSKWAPDPVTVSGGSYYTFSDWYKSNRTSAVSVYYELETDAADSGHWSNLFSGIAPASEWTQYKTGFTMPAGAVRAQFVHFIAGIGSLETDDYSLTEEASPTGFSKPMVSLTFDDGSQGFYDSARLELNAKGFKTTQYIPTAGITSLDTFMMTRDEIATLAREGNEIGSHSVSHPDLTTVTDPQKLADEFVNSKNVLEAIPGVGAIRNFAYPFGTYDARVIAAAEKAGYRSGRSVEEGYNSKLDLEPFDIRVQNMTYTTTLAQFKGWVDYANAHRYWLAIVYHEVVPDDAARCTNTAIDPDVCLGDYDTTVTNFRDQLAYIASANPAPDVLTVEQALDAADAEIHQPVAGTVKVKPAGPTTKETLTATPDGFTDPDTAETTLAYQYEWLVNGTAIAGATASTFDLSQAGNGDHGDVVTVNVSARDPEGHVSTGVSDSVTVANTAPAGGSVAISPASPVAGTALNATPSGFVDADGDSQAYAYSWFREGQAIAGEATSTLPGSELRAGDAIRVEVRADDGHGGTSEAVTATVSVGTVLPAATPTATPGPSATATPARAPDRTAPRIVVTSPKARSYKVGRLLKVKFSCTDGSGYVQCKATVRRSRGTARTVKQGGKLRLSRAGSYALRVTAEDRSGNIASQTVRFRVVRK